MIKKTDHVVRNNLFLLVLCIVMVFLSVNIIVKASTSYNWTSEDIKSRGRFVYDHDSAKTGDEIIIDAADLKTIGNNVNYINQETGKNTGEINNLKTAAAALADSFGLLEQNIGSQAASITDLDGRVTAINDNVTTINDNVTTMNNSVTTINSNLGDFIISSEGSGENTKYFIQSGADAASKKPLEGDRDITVREFGNWGYFNINGDVHQVDISSVPNYQELKLWINIFPSCTVYTNLHENYIANIEYSYDYRTGMVSLNTKSGDAGDAKYMVVHVVTAE